MDRVNRAVYKFLPFGYSCSGKGLKIMNLGDVQTTDGVARVLQDEEDDAVDPHLERIKNLAGGDESDEEVKSFN
jgi:structure-specific recognition protein 1